MKTQEVINKLQELVNKHGNLPFHINIEHAKNANTEMDVLDGDIFHDEGLKDICIILR